MRWMMIKKRWTLLSLEIAQAHRTFYDAPWNVGRLYEELSPLVRGRLVLTVRYYSGGRK